MHRHRRFGTLFLGLALWAPLAASAQLEDAQTRFKADSNAPFDHNASAQGVDAVDGRAAGRGLRVLEAPLSLLKRAPEPPMPHLIKETKQSWLRGWLNEVGRRPFWRDVAAVAVNSFGAYPDRFYNNRSLEEMHKTTPIPNLHQVDDKVWRGGEATPEGWRMLKKLGVDLVINLRYEDNDEAAGVKAAGLDAFYLPIPDTDIPTPQQVLDFFALLELNKDKTVFIHCAAGEMRTSAMVGLYELFHGASYQAVLSQALSYGFDPQWMRAYRENKLLQNFSRDPRRWLALASQLDRSQRGERRQTLLILP